ncbi:hypothetical protein [Synechococcus sp. PCC 7336]|uniref:hypothetical protein n=1 Tax=Synechococcus sp. PCC 7336 TaxID=195250 RepID=UPI0003452E4C|nr:hypothetical protein [Synechococcus sp. PCC 7336]
MSLDTEVLPNIYAFRPNRESLGGTAYALVRRDRHSSTFANLLVDCPAATPQVCDRLAQLGGVRWIALTHRTAIGSPAASTSSVAKIAKRFDCDVVVQEQEAYLLPHLRLLTFGDRLDLAPDIQFIWTPGHTPGSSCVFYADLGGVLFSGRHLLPDAGGRLNPLRQAKTFHWPRQLRNVGKLLDVIPAPAPAWICPGANTGELQGKKVMDAGRDRLLAAASEAYTA